jgi:hypothetical protein
VIGEGSGGATIGHPVAEMHPRCKLANGIEIVTRDVQPAAARPRLTPAIDAGTAVNDLIAAVN